MAPFMHGIAAQDWPAATPADAISAIMRIIPVLPLVALDNTLAQPSWPHSPLLVLVRALITAAVGTSAPLTKSYTPALGQAVCRSDQNSLINTVNPSDHLAYLLFFPRYCIEIRTVLTRLDCIPPAQSAPPI